MENNTEIEGKSTTLTATYGYKLSFKKRLQLLFFNNKITFKTHIEVKEKPEVLSDKGELIFD